MPPQGQKNQHVFQAPKGTRDLYPQDLAKRRYVTNAWRDAAIAHGFNEINGPTFEHLDLYTVKSGDAIVSELFSFRRAKGDTDYALRPEFTPTLARMYAAKANSLAKPTKWFSIGPYFRAERPQRGSLREFLQWNLDVVGDDSAQADAEIIAGCIGMLEVFGLTPDDCKIHINDRNLVSELIAKSGAAANETEALALLDKRAKLKPEVFSEAAAKIDFDMKAFDELVARASSQTESLDHPAFAQLKTCLADMGVDHWCRFDIHIVRGLAYYTGMVFEVIAEGERAVAGGGRYDGLIELFGGPPTPAVGFAIGDIVLSLLLEEKGLMPEGSQLADTLSAAPVSNRPDAFVITGNDEFDPIVTQTIATLRRERLHARGTYKATRNVGKLLKEASTLTAKNVIIIETADTCTVKNLDEGKQEDAVALSALPTLLGR